VLSTLILCYLSAALQVGYLGGINRFGRQLSCVDFIEVSTRLLRVP